MARRTVRLGQLSGRRGPSELAALDVYSVGDELDVVGRRVAARATATKVVGFEAGRDRTNECLVGKTVDVDDAARAVRPTADADLAVAAAMDRPGPDPASGIG